MVFFGWFCGLAKSFVKTSQIANKAKVAILYWLRLNKQILLVSPVVKLFSLRHDRNVRKLYNYDIRSVEIAGYLF